MENSLNENIKRLRILWGMSQIELGSKLGVSKQCVSNWENGNVQPSIDMLMKLSNHFNVSTDELLGISTSETLLVNGLTEKQKAHLRLLISDFKEE